MHGAEVTSFGKSIRIGPGRPLARGQKGRELDPVGQAVGARGQHVVEAARVVGGVRLDVGLGRGNQSDEDDRPEDGDETPHVTSLSDRAAA